MIGELTQNLDRFGCVLTKDETFVIIFGGRITRKVTGKLKEIESEWSDEIFFYNLDTNKVEESLVRCPEKGAFTAIRSPDDEIFLQGAFDGDQYGHWRVRGQDLLKVCDVCVE